ncbi:SPOR domain-containing protein [Ponticoccus alexandrii]|uniref:SPOR domain-containing protein n=1 Tax=Ponticoccus alexandrii TaxID=1943633 RepID=A0ABX7FAM5_9RHOB|nr:SPOR domain-containing protein [Ponticoccus alexandrii]ETA49949.1 hypothetical protein P279_22110 [Rhodobacteraceae bacterium PD-2]QRF66417.1 SPOR domain-containing protein [Ponticoccus alexandrii]
MADYTYDGAYGAPASVKVASLAHWLGAAASVALVVGVGVWGYKVMARDVSGVPVVMALAGPMREAPVDPGGTLADHQGLAVNTVAGLGAAASPADRLVLAPRAAGLGAEDVAAGLLVPAERPEPMRTSLAANAEIVEIEPRLPENPDAQLAALVESIGGEALEPLDGGDVVPVVTSVGETSLAEDTTQAASLGPGLARSLRPNLRPAGLRSAAAAPQASAAVAEGAAPAVATREIDPSQLASGTRLVQIGAYDSAELARSEWDKLGGRLGEFLDGKDRVVQKASSGGRTFYRLRAHGFEDLADARRFCSALVSQNIDCIPVVTR